MQRSAAIASAAVCLSLAALLLGSNARAEVVDCKPSKPLAVPKAPARCTAKAGSAAGLLLLRGKVLAPGKVFAGGEVLIKGFGPGRAGTIACAACSCAGRDPGYATATVVDCPAAVISPGLINAHDHITFNGPEPTPHQSRFMHRQEWRRGMSKTGEPDLKDARILRDPARVEMPPDDKYPDHAEVVRKLNATNKAVVNYSELRHLFAGTTSGQTDDLGVFLLNLETGTAGKALHGHQKKITFATFPLGDGAAGKRIYEKIAEKNPTRKAKLCSIYNAKGAADTLAAVDAYVAHMAEGINHAAHNELACANALFDGAHAGKLALVHAVGVGLRDAKLLEQKRTKVVWSPRSNIDLYSYTAPVVMLDKHNVTIALASDWLASGSMNLLRELKCAAHLNADNYGGHFSDESLWKMVTENAAKATGTADMLGKLQERYVADVAVYAEQKGAGAHRAVVAARPEDVVLVLRAGTPLYGDAALMGSLGAAASKDANAACEPLDVCGSAKSACVRGAAGATIAGLRKTIADNAAVVEEVAAAISKAKGAAAVAYSPKRKSLARPYPLFFCGQPQMEPSCQLNRTREGRYFGYTGRPSRTGKVKDSDGDGIPDDLDQCPKVFSAPRPMDDGLVSDEACQ